MLILFIKHSLPVFSAYNKKLPERTGRTLIREKTLKTAPVKTHSHLTVPGMKNKAFSSAPTSPADSTAVRNFRTAAG